jgi:Xaa-Pro aminopeptidase
MPLSRRLRKLLAAMHRLDLDALLINHDIDIHYLTEYPAHDAWLLVTPSEVFYITDGRYIEEVKKGLRGITAIQYNRSIFEEVVTCCRKARVRRMGIDERRLTVDQHKRLKGLCHKSVSIVEANTCVDQLRVIKEPGELLLMREALRLDLKAYRYIKPWIKPGVSELDILHRLEGFIRKEGVAFAFDPIIASGPNSAYPHARVTGRKLCRKEPVLIDLGMDYKGYKSDLTRMFFLDTMPASYKNDLSIVHDAQHEAFKVIKPGVLAKEVDAVVRNYLKKHGLAERFTHSLGHGVGMEVHEAPRLSVSSDAVLQENMVCTVEPGVYFPGKYGIRLEEMVLVTKKGCEILSSTMGV